MINLQNLVNNSGVWNGAWWNIASEPFSLQFSVWSSINPVDNATYYIWQWIAWTTLTATGARIYIQKKCKLKKCFVFTRWNTSSAEWSTLSILVNWSTAYTVTNTYDTTASNSQVSNVNMDILLNVWDYIVLQWITPAWATNPTSVNLVSTIRLEPIPASATWQYIMQWWAHVSSSPVAITEYHLYDISAVSGASWWTNCRVHIPKAGTVVWAYLYVRTSTSSSSELFTYSIRKNDTTDYTITSSAKLDWISNIFTNNAMSIPVVAGDWVTLKKVTPVWITAPTSIIEKIILVIQI